MWARMVVAPWWARWLLSALEAALVITWAVVLLFPKFLAVTGWLWGVVALAGFSLAAAAAGVCIQHPIRQNYAATVTGLNLLQRSQIVNALRRGHIPSDPRVLAAAIRVGALNLAYLRRTPRWQRTAAKWWMPPLLGGMAVMGFIGNEPRRGVFWTGFAVFLVSQSTWLWYKTRRLPQHIELLRAATADIPEALTGAEDPVALPPRRLWLSTLLVVVGGIAGGAIAFLSDRPTPDCRTADAVVNHIAAHPDMLDARLITPGEPDLIKYQDWSNQLQSYARQVSTPDISHHIHRIAELSTQAVSLVQDIRKDLVASTSTDVILDRETAYHNTVTQLINEDKALISICHPHS